MRMGGTVMEKKGPRVSFKKTFGLLLCPYLFTKKDIRKLLKQLPEIQNRKIEEIADTLVALESLHFEDFRTVILTYPKLLLVDAYQLSEQVQRLLRKYHDMEPMREEILELYH